MATDGQGNTDTLSGIENLTGSEHDDSLTGDAGVNIINGGSGNDTLIGNGGADTYLFEDNWMDDHIVTLDDAVSTLDFSRVTSDLFFTLHASGNVSVQDNINPLAENDDLPDEAADAPDAVSTLSDVDNIRPLVGGSGDNTFIFDEGAEFAGTIDGGSGDNNRLDYSGSYRDVQVNTAAGTATGVQSFTNIHGVIIGQGNYDLIGSAASETVSYVNARGNVTIDLLNGNFSKTAPGVDTISGFENIEGSAFNDRLIGDNNGNVIEGGAGEDYMVGHTGDDVYKFKDGWGADTVIELDGEGTDVLDFSGITQDLTFTIHSGGAVSVTDGVNTVGPVNSIEKLIDGSGDDTFVFEDGAVFEGQIGETNAFFALLGLDEGSGTNTLDFSGYTTSVSVDLGVTLPLLGFELPAFAYETESGDPLIQALFNVNSVIGGAGDDFIWGTYEEDVLVGGAGDDVIYGRDAVDTIEGGAGDDMIYGGAEPSVISALNVLFALDPAAFLAQFGAPLIDHLADGGSFEDFLKEILAGDKDIASYASAGAWVEIDLRILDEQDTISAGMDTLIDIQSVTGSAYNDILIGDAFGNVLFGGDGNDTLKGGEGSDTLEGGAGNDLLDGEIGDKDIASYAKAEDGVSLDLSITTAQDTGTLGLDTLLNMDGLEGSAFDDTLLGNAGDNFLIGGAGNDILEGRLGLNYLSGGEGSDTVSYANATAGVFVDMRLLLPQYTVGAGWDSFETIENLTGSAYNDTLIGGYGNNVLIGGLGDDALYGKEGSDTYAIHDGWTSGDQIIDDLTIDLGLMPDDEAMAITDTLDFSSISANLTFTINADGTVTVEDGSQTLSGLSDIESIIGGSGDNTVVFADGGAFAGIIDGGSGGSNTLDYTAYSTDVTVDLRIDENEGNAGTATGTNGVVHFAMSSAAAATIPSPAMMRPTNCAAAPAGTRFSAAEAATPCTVAPATTVCTATRARTCSTGKPATIHSTAVRSATP